MGAEHTEARPAPLRGYRKLSDEELALLDEIKLMEDEVAKLWAKVDASRTTVHGTRYSLRSEGLFRDAFMNLTRAVALPRDPYREALGEDRV